MSFNASLTKYTLVERPAISPTGTGIGIAGWQAQTDVINAENGDVIVAASTTPRAAAIAALNGASVSANALVSYQNSSGSVVYERTLATAT